MKLETKAQGLRGSLRIPGDKSISHRSISQHTYLCVTETKSS